MALVQADSHSGHFYYSAVSPIQQAKQFGLPFDTALGS